MSIQNSSNRLFKVGQAVEAFYRNDVNPLYKHNCFIEALPAPLSESKIAEKIERYPQYDEKDRHLPTRQREQAVQALAHVIVPMPEFITIEQKISRVIEDGYMARNPLKAEYIRQLKSAFPNIEQSTGAYQLIPEMKSTSAGFAIIGCSGVGKSTIVESVLDLYPQRIIHTSYNGHALDQQQLVWLKLECAHDGSRRGLCINFFQAIDQALGDTRYGEQYADSKRSTDMLMPQMANLAARLGLGVLVIDEIQRLLRSKKEEEAACTLEFLVQLTNVMKIPVILVGTYKAYSLFTKNFALARRVTGQGQEIFANPAKDAEWDFFIDKIWKFQWTDVPTPLTEELKEAMYYESQGIPDVAIKLYMLTQRAVIGSGHEVITPQLIHEVAYHALGPVATMLKALREHDMDKLSEIEDIILPNFDSVLASVKGQICLHGTSNTLDNQQKAANVGKAQGPSPKDEIADILIQAGYTSEIAVKCSTKAVNRFAKEMDFNNALIEAIRLAKEETSPETSAPAVKKASRKKANGDLRLVVKGSTDAFKSLQEAGNIRSADEFTKSTKN